MVTLVLFELLVQVYLLFVQLPLAVDQLQQLGAREQNGASQVSRQIVASPVLLVQELLQSLLFL